MLQQVCQTLTQKIDALVARGDAVLSASAQPIQQTALASSVITKQLSELVSAVRKGQGLLGQLMLNDAMAQDVNETLINANHIAERVAEQPEILIWGSSKDDTAAARQAREATKQRRAFMEGYERRVIKIQQAETETPAP